MSRSARLIITGLAFLGALFAAPRAASQPAATVEQPPLPPLGGVDQAELYRLVKHFDFDEREQGNYEDTPMHWSQLRGQGLPTLRAKGRFDDDVGHQAPPSFRLDIQTGNVAYEYRYLDLAVVPESDYFVVGYVRPAGLRHSRAFVAAYFVDRFGDRIPGSDRVSNLVCATGRDSEPWQRVEIALPGEFPTAHALRLQLWILQSYAWRKPDPHAVDPILRRDVYASAWFDDLSVYRLPRVELRLSNPAGLVLPGRQEEFILEVNNATSQPLLAELRIIDSTGQLRQTRKLDVPALADPAGPAPVSPPGSHGTSSDDLALVMDQQSGMASIRAAVPELTPGFYQAHLRLLGGTEALLERRARFAVLPELPTQSLQCADIGVDLGRWEHSEIAGVRELLTALGCGAIKIGIPMLGPLDSDEKKAYFQELSALLRVLAENRIDATGVILPPGATAASAAASESVCQLVERDDVWRDLFSPAVAYFGALLPTWQLGAEQIELRDGRLWQRTDVERVRRHLRRFITIPRLAIPQPISAVRPDDGDVACVWVPPEVPTRALPRQLGFLVDVESSACWLQLARDVRGNLSSEQRMTDLARRLVLAKALGPGRIFVPAPFQLSRQGGRAAWQPTEEYLVLRTLFHYLCGKTAVAAMTPVPDTLAIVFEGVDSSCMVVWSWRDQPPTEPVELYLGPSPRAIDIWGQPVTLGTSGDRTRLPAGPTPLIIEELHTPLALLQASYRVAPTYVQVHEPEPRPVLTFRNTYDTRLTGEVRLNPPGSWLVEPAVRSFQLEPGETFVQPLTLTLPPRQVAQTHELEIRLTLHAPESAELRFVEALRVGLREIGLEATAYWQGDNLAVEQSLRNLSNRVVSFTAFCEPPGRARVEGIFLDVAPGEASTLTYLFEHSRDLAGARLHLGIQEIDGGRSLNQFADVPQ